VPGGVIMRRSAISDWTYCAWTNTAAQIPDTHAGHRLGRGHRWPIGNSAFHHNPVL